MKIEYILVVVLALGAMAFLGNWALNRGNDANAGAEQANEVLQELGNAAE